MTKLTEDETPFRQLRLVSAATIADDVPTWAWEHGGKGRIAMATVSLFAGRPGAGKSTSARWFVADATRGRLDGEWSGAPVNAAYLGAEESAKYIIKPGLRAADADLDRVFFPTVTFQGEEVKFLSSQDMHSLTEELIAADVKIVVVDPMMSTIGSKTDINRNNEIRSLFDPWRRLAEHIQGVVLGIVHLNKAGNGDVVAGINGSSAFGEIARSVFGFAKDPDSEEGDRILSQEKNSLGDEDLALTYRIESVQVTTDSGKTAPVGRFVIIGDSDRSVSDVLRDARNGRTTDTDDLKEIDKWLTDFLSQGSQKATDIYSAADATGYSKDQAKRAKKRLKIVAERPVIPGPWFWALSPSKDAESTEPSRDTTGAPLLPSTPLQVDGTQPSTQGSQGSNGASAHGSPPPALIGRWIGSGEPLNGGAA